MLFYLEWPVKCTHLAEVWTLIDYQYLFFRFCWSVIDTHLEAQQQQAKTSEFLLFSFKYVSLCHDIF